MELSDELRIEMLQLQKAALIDTQTIFQILVDKGICAVDEVVSTRERIEAANPDVHSLDVKIANLKGEELPQQPSKTELLAQLRQLIDSLNISPSTLNISEVEKDDRK